MTVHKLSAGDGYTYLTRHVATADQHRSRGQDLAGYYTASGNPPGVWLGAGARELGMSGTVSEAQMVALFGQGRHPDAERIAAGERSLGSDPLVVDELTLLGRPFPTRPAVDGRRPVAGYDLVFTPVKSVSVLWALGDTDLRAQVEAAHRDAVADVVGWLEREAAFTRLGRNGPAQVDTHGLVCAAFEHRDSRLGDPDLHTHVAVSNKVRATVDLADGRARWLALDARVLYQAGVAASERYNTRIEDGIRARLGCDFAERPDTVRRDKRPVREIVGMPVELIREFSRRRAVIEDRFRDLSSHYRNTHGREPSKATQVALAQQATLDTRGGKQLPDNHAEQRYEWRTRADVLLGPAGSRRLVNTVTHPARTAARCDAVDVDQLAAQVIDTLETERATWSRWNLRAEVERVTRSVPVADPAARDALVDTVQARATSTDGSIRIETPAMVEDPLALRRDDGASVFTVHGSERYTTPRVLDAEQALLTAASERTGVAVGRDLAEEAMTVLARRGADLDPGQRALVLSFATDDTRLVAAVGPAGSGKTTATRAVCAVFDAAGRRVIPLATSARAADVLSAELGRRAENLHKFLHDHALDPADRFFRVGVGDVVLVDEAGMAGTHQLHDLTRAARETGAVVRLLGDPAQLGAVGTGGALGLLARDTGAVELTALHRFADPAEAAATLRLRHGDPTALDFYDTHHRTRSGTADAMVDAAFAGWQGDVDAGRPSLMGAADADTVRQLCGRARLHRVATGEVDPAGVELHDGNRAAVGDWVVTRANNRTLASRNGSFVKNGDRWRVLEHHGDGTLSVEHLTHHGRLRLPSDYVRDDVELAYATTAHRAQGATVDTAHAVITDTTSREAMYVLATRARRHTDLYVATDGTVDLDQHHPPEPPRTARQVLEQVLGQSTAEVSATETIRRTQADPERLSFLLDAYEHTLANAPARAVAAHRRDLRRNDIALPAWVGLGVPGGGPPSVDDARWHASLNDRAGQINRRIDILAARAVRTRAPWLALGGPEPSAQALAAVRTVAAYREQYDIHGQASLLGERPTGRQAAAYDIASAARDRLLAPDPRAMISAIPTPTPTPRRNVAERPPLQRALDR